MERRRVWSATASRFAQEAVGTLYKERVEHRGEVTPGWEAYRDFVLALLAQACDKIVDDPTTRQAMIAWPWRSYMDNPPCLNAVQFLWRDGVLDVVAFMRSSSRDKWTGDLMFLRWVVSQAERALLARDFNVDMKFLHVFKGSDHYYEGEQFNDVLMQSPGE